MSDLLKEAIHMAEDRIAHHDEETRALKAEIERLTDKLHRIKQWCKAYPRTVFIEPTDEMWAEANRVLDAAEGCPSLTAISGSNMRHVVEGIQKVAAVDKEES